MIRAERAPDLEAGLPLDADDLDDAPPSGWERSRRLFGVVLDDWAYRRVIDTLAAAQPGEATSGAALDEVEVIIDEAAALAGLSPLGTVERARRRMDLAAFAGLDG